MGKIYQGILGPVSGKVGGTVGGSWKGISTVKGYQPIVSNPKTAAQVANRSLMAYCVAFAQVILATVIKPCWDRFASRMSGYNSFVSANKALFTTALPSVFADLKTSIGKMAATSMASFVTTAAATTAEITWLDDSGQGFKLATDKVYVVIINQTQGTVKGFATSAIRSNLSVEVDMDANFVAGNVCHAYLTFLRADGSVVSNNSYETAIAA